MDNQYKYIESKLSEKDDYFNPSDKVWKGIEKNLWPKRRTSLLLWLLGSSSIFILGIFLINSVSFDNQLAEPVEQRKKVASEIKPDANQTFTNSTSVKDIQSINANFQSIDSKTSLSSQFTNGNGRSKSVELNKTFEDPAKSSEIVDGENSKINVGDIIEINESQNVTGANELTINSNNIVTAKQPEKDIEPLQPLGLPSLALLDFSSVFTMEEDPFISPVQFSSKGFLSAGLWLGVPIEKTKVYSNNPLSETIVNSDYINIQGTSLNYRHVFSDNFSFSVGLGYAQAKSRTSYALAIAYDLNNEIHDASTSSYDNTFVHSLPSAGGDIKSVLTLNRSDQSDVAHNDAVHLDLVTETNEQILHIPMGVSYHLNQPNKGLFISAHLDALMAFNKDVNNVELVQHHDIVSVKQGILESANNYHLGLTTGLSLGYSIPLFSNSLSIDLMTGIQQGLTYEVPFRSWQSSIMVTKRLY